MTDRIKFGEWHLVHIPAEYDPEDDFTLPSWWHPHCTETDVDSTGADYDCSLSWEIVNVGEQDTLRGLDPGWWCIRTWFDPGMGGPWGPAEADAGVEATPLVAVMPE